MSRFETELDDVLKRMPARTFRTAGAVMARTRMAADFAQKKAIHKVSWRGADCTLGRRSNNEYPTAHYVAAGSS